MNPTNLARSIVYWLEFERLCGRAHLFSESALKQPIGQHLLASTEASVEPEYQYPDPNQPTGSGRRRAMDFGLLRRGGQRALQHVIESKFINSKREFKQEICDDLFRLAWFELPNQDEPCHRWLVIAGVWTNIETKVFAATIRLRKGGAVSEAFRGVLPKELTSPDRHPPIDNAAPGRRKLWVEAATAFDATQIPNAIHVKLAARNPIKPHHSGYSCFIWKITRTGGWRTYPF
jgi:hypothetical protein